MDERNREAGRIRGEWLVVAVILLAFVGILGPLIHQSHRIALTVRCRQRLMQVFSALQSYAISHGGLPPAHHGPGGDWRAALEPMLPPGLAGRDDFWACPAGGPYLGNREVFRPEPRPLGDYRLQRQVGLIADGLPTHRAAGVSDARGLDWRHRGGANVLFVDGRVEWILETKRQALERHWDDPQ
jgi:prepilin-type processing-associated H-X9-DG protein